MCLKKKTRHFLSREIKFLLTTVDAIDLIVTVSYKTEGSFESNAVKYSIIGLAVTSVLLFIIYLYTHLLEKCQVRNKTV